jgi:DNA-binding MarR family transcriptional regulator
METTLVSSDSHLLQAACALLSAESNFYNSTSMSKPHLALLLERASRVVADRLMRDIGLDGVTSDHWRVLRHLSDGAGHAMGELAEREGINPPTLTKLVDRMVSKSMVQRAADPEDSRRVLVFATDAGLELFNQLQSRVEQHHASMGALLGPRNARQLERLLMLLIEESERPAA